MGLDISAYSKIKPESDGEFFIGSDNFGRHQDIPEGEYTSTNESNHHSFRAGSYSGYNRWREDLSMAIHGVMPAIIWESPEKFEEKDFFEIINFSDCEGCMGPQTSAKLHNDFVKNRDSFVGFMEDRYGKIDNDGFSESAYRVRVYDDFTKAFEIAKDSGVLIFC